MRRSALAVAVLLMLVAAGVRAQTSAQADRVTAAVDVREARQLKGHVPRWASKKDDLGAVSADEQLDNLTVLLARSSERQAAFEQLLADQQNPASARYHQWLTPQQVGEQYGPTQNDIDAVTTWLTGQGLRVDAVTPARTMITFSGPSGRVARALGTEFHRYKVRVGAEAQTRIAVSREPSVPAALAAVIAGFSGLSEERLVPHSHVMEVPTPQTEGGLRPEYTSGSYHYLAPGDFATIFDINTVYNAGVTGSGVKVAIIGRSRVLASDITSFETKYGLSATAQPVTVIPTTGTDPGYANGDQGEQTLDVNRVMGTATGAEADLVVSASSKTTDGVSIAALYEVNTLVDPIMTISYGSCELSAGLSGDNYWSNIFSQGAAEGITAFVSSGDSAVSACAKDFSAPTNTETLTASINYICASPYLTCVGGTEFNDTGNPTAYWSTTNSSTYTSALGYIPEGGWNEPLNGSTYVVAGSTGGVSLYVVKPTWQAGTGVPADGFRDVPDVALPSAGHDGYLSVLSGSTTAFAGTSAAAPGMAGILALVEQKLGAAQGNINPELYALGTAGSNAFHDVTVATSGVTNCSVATASMCNNSTPSATALTGWGSVDVGNLLTALTSKFLVGQGTSFAVTAGNSGTSSVTVSSLSGFAGTVAMTCAVTTAPAGATGAPVCTPSPTSATLTSGSTATVTVTITTTATHARSGVSAAGMGWMGAGVCVLLLLGVRRRRLQTALAAGLMVMLLGAAVGCGGGGSVPSSSSATILGTTAGSYVATVTGTSALATANGTVSFTVN
jgi:subtilase family serine protease